MDSTSSIPPSPSLPPIPQPWNLKEIIKKYITRKTLFGFMFCCIVIMAIMIFSLYQRLSQQDEKVSNQIMGLQGRISKQEEENAAQEKYIKKLGTGEKPSMVVNGKEYPVVPLMVELLELKKRIEEAQ